MKSSKDQTIALAAVLQSAILVDRLATHGDSDEEARRALLDSLYAFDAPTAEAIYNGCENLKIGVGAMLDLFNRHEPQRLALPLQYAMSMLHLGSKLLADKDRLDIIDQRLRQLLRNAPYQEGGFGREVEALASIYQDTISTYRQRIQVSGQPDHLRNTDIANQIRALLLSGIRATILWKQSGGSRWQLLLCRGRLKRVCLALAHQQSAATPFEINGNETRKD